MYESDNSLVNGTYTKYISSENKFRLIPSIGFHGHHKFPELKINPCDVRTAQTKQENNKITQVTVT